MEENQSELFVGFDLSTQQLKAVIIDRNGIVVHRFSINFSRDLSKYGTVDGVLIAEDGRTVNAPVHMWIEAVDMILEKISKNVDMSRIRCLSGCAQQHGTVYWANGSGELLSSLDFSKSFDEQLKKCFSRDVCPIWMDSSTFEQCQKLENNLRGPEILTQITGSRANLRFSGPQIMKIFENEPNVWKSTERISLISSFLCSLFIGKYANIDYTDGSGMNVMNIKNQRWDEQCLKSICGSQNIVDLQQKLGDICNPSIALGTISRYLVDRYGFSSDCNVLPFIGDNPASLAALSLSPNDIAISLGTSDTLFFTSSQYKPCTDAHVFSHFNGSANAFMGLVCFKNGSLTRERIRTKTGLSWNDFGKILDETPVGNKGLIGIFFDSDEIAPRCRRGVYYFDEENCQQSEITIKEKARAVMESQCLWKRFYAERMGWSRARQGRLMLTGGGSINSHMQQILADVFGMPVYTINEIDSAALGGAMRARYDFCAPKMSYDEYNRQELSRVAEPIELNQEIFDKIFDRYADVVNKLREFSY
ncbi:unnamed protein product [Auanema sp. JU1783]|nr:unnamed protein product [Auanema sp. JU1783]